MYGLLNGNARIIWSYDLLHEKPFGYRVENHGYLLTSCQDKVV